MPTVECEFEVPAAAAAQRVEHWLAPRLPLLSATKLRVLFTQHDIRCNGRVIPSGYRLRTGDRIQLLWDPARLPPLLPEPLPLELLYQDQELLAVDKPAGMLMHPTMGVKRGTLANAILALWNPWLTSQHLVNPTAEPVFWPYFLHRLDRETSGVVLIARKRSTASLMGRQWTAHAVHKCYVAILEGTMDGPELIVDAAIGRVADQAPHWQVTPQGAPAQSRIQPILQQDGQTLCILQPITGRTNQLRIHAASIGHPIAGDIAYGAAESTRLFLHAWTLCFEHPYSGHETTVEAPLPSAMEAIWPGATQALHTALHRECPR